MHLDYNQKDSIAITISGPDSVSNIVNARAAATNNNEDLSNNNSISVSARLNGSDKNINVKVTAKNTFNQIEKDVKNEETIVIVRLLAGQYRDYTLQAPYNTNTGFYSLPLSSAGITYKDGNAIDKTIGLIKSTLNIACAKTNSADPNIDKSVLKLIAASICPIPHPYAKAVCAAASTLLFACKAGKILDLLNRLVYIVDGNAIPFENAAVTVFSQHYTYGTKFSTQTSVDQILLNQTGYDIKITHDYTETKPFLTGATYSLVTWRFGASIPGLVNLQVVSAPPVYTYVGRYIAKFDTDKTFSHTVYDSLGNVSQHTTGNSYSIGSYSSDSLFIPQGGGPTSTYAHQYPEGWGFKLPPGYNLSLAGYVCRLSKDGSFFYEVGDYVYAKQ